MIAALASSICIGGVAFVLGKRPMRSLVSELAVFGVADAYIAATIVSD